MANKLMLGTDLSKRIYGLDILRAIAIFFVLVFHTLEFFPQASQVWIVLFVKYGVSIFFALSGYLIGGILIKSFNKPDLSFTGLVRFWCNRWMRTLPPYYFTLLLLLAVMYAFDLGSKPSHLTNGQLARFFVFLQNFDKPRLAFFPESWSLSIEEWFYLITPSILFVLYKFVKIDLKRSIIATIVIIIASVLAIRGYRAYVGIAYDEFQVVNRLDSLMYGVLGAYIAYYYRTYWDKAKNKFLAIGILILLGILINDQYVFSMSQHNLVYLFVHSLIDGSLIPIVIFFFLPYFSNLKTGTGFIYKTVTYTSLISYSLYLLHLTFVKHCIVDNINKHVVELDSVAQMVLIWGISFGLATVMYLYLEKPFMDLRKKIKFLNK